jgi:hypothetical protein
MKQKIGFLSSDKNGYRWQAIRTNAQSHCDLRQKILQFFNLRALILFQKDSYVL